MVLNIKTNRFNIWVWWLILLIPYVIAYAITLYYTYISKDESLKSEVWLVIFGGVFLCICCSIIAFYQFWGRKLHQFSRESIKVFNHKELIYDININDITEIKYIKCNIKYIWNRLSGDSMDDGYACKMYVMTQGNAITLGCFSLREANRIKKLYGDLVKII